MSPRALLGSGLLRTVVVALAGALLLSGCDFSVYSLPLPGGAKLGDHPYTVKVEFRDVLDLVPQSAVKVDDISVGRVEDIKADGYIAKVSLLLNSDVKLPDNAEAEIRQTSLLGEKFVSLSPPPSNPSPNPLGNGDVIGLDHSGRNIEVEEVLGALSLLLNGGGVGQAKTITEELNKTFSGHEGAARDVLDQIRIFMHELDNGKEGIVTALRQVNSLSKALNRHTGDLDLALDELPPAIASVSRQRDDLVRMLKALSHLSSVGTRVIEASKAGTIRSLNSLAPVLTALASAGSDFPRSLQIILTFPFIDAVVGKNPQQARDLHMGDYTNLSIDLQLALKNVLGGENPIDTAVCDNLPEPLKDQCVSLLEAGKKLTKKIIKALEDAGVAPGDIPGLPGGLPLAGSGGTPGGAKGGGTKGGGTKGGGTKGGGILGGGGGPLGLGRAPVGSPVSGATRGHGDGTSGADLHGVDAGLAAMLLWGAMPR
jgi:phospholipid/cholesterol/gamma-HCH transport system substrate-binding protein